MEYRLALVERPTYLHTRVTGPNSRENATRFLMESYEACVASGRNALLLEMSLSGPSLDASSIFRIVAERTGDALKLRKIAYVESSREKDEGKVHFAETVAVNRGVNVKLFRDVGEAERWLLEP